MKQIPKNFNLIILIHRLVHKFNSKKIITLRLSPLKLILLQQVNKLRKHHLKMYPAIIPLLVQ